MRLGSVASATDPGRRRRRNEDAFVCEPPLFAVADGMGGARAGELASRLAAAALRPGDSSESAPPEERVTALIQEANRRVYERSSEDDSVSGMGTTVTAALVADGTVTVGHVGDSRAYLVRDGTLERITDDHSLVAELMRDGQLSPEEAETHPQRSVITRSVGTDPDVDVDTHRIEARPGDLFLLVTDGLTSMVDEEQILTIVERNRRDLRAGARALIRAANRGGGDDNITVVCFEIADVADAEATAETAVGPVVGDELEEEDTLSELDEVPAAEPPPLRARRSRAGRRIAFGLSALSLLALLCVAGLWGLSRSHFVGADDDGQVSVYQGIPYDLGGGVRLYRAVYVSPLLAAQLTRPERRELFDHDLEGYGAALSGVKRLEREIVR